MRWQQDPAQSLPSHNGQPAIVPCVPLRTTETIQECRTLALYCVLEEDDAVHALSVDLIHDFQPTDS